jgi:hypothetical protein
MIECEKIEGGIIERDNRSVMVNRGKKREG